MLVGFSGLKGVGKDEAANFLVKQGFQKFAFGDEIYREVSEAFGVSEAQLRSREWKVTVQDALALRNCKDAAFVQMVIAAEMPKADYQISPFCTEAHSCPRNSSFIVQRWATEYRRRDNKNYWVDRVAAKMMLLPRGTNIVISDVREDHEAEFMEWYTRVYGPMKCGIAELVMPGAVHTGHSSDNGLSRQYVEAIINSNPGDIAGLQQQVADFVRNLKWKASQYQ